MVPEIFPKEILDNSAEVFRHSKLKQSHLIYWIILIFIMFIIAVLPFVEINIYSSARGHIRSTIKRTKIVSPIQGVISEIRIKENQHVSLGDTLIKFDDQVIRTQLANIQLQIDLLKDVTHDLTILLQENQGNTDSIKTELFKSEWLAYCQNIKDLTRKHQQHRADFIREKKLFSTGVIAKVQYLKSEFDLEISKNRLDNFRKQQQIAWQTQLRDSKIELKGLETRKTELLHKKELHYIKATLDGTIQDLIPMAVGSALPKGIRITDLSPDSDLIVECFVSSADIGAIKRGNQIKYLIDAFDHRFWGMKTGTVIEIAEDISLVGKTPVYKVLGSMNNPKFNSKSNQAMDLQKGMQLTAKFLVARRTLVQLILNRTPQRILNN